MILSSASFDGRICSSVSSTRGVETRFWSSAAVALSALVALAVVCAVLVLVRYGIAEG